MDSNKDNCIDTSMCKPCAIKLYRLKTCNLKIISSDFRNWKNGEQPSHTITLTRSDFDVASSESEKLTTISIDTSTKNIQAIMAHSKVVPKSTTMSKQSIDGKRILQNGSVFVYGCFFFNFQYEAMNRLRLLSRRN